MLNFFFFSVRERAEFNKSCNLIGSGSGRNFSIRSALGGRNRHLLKNVSILSGNLLNDLCYHVSKNLPVKPFFNLDYLCFHYYLLAIARSVCRESCHGYSPKMFGSFARLSLCCRKKIKMLFTKLGRSVLGKTVPSVLSTDLGLRPRAVSKTSGTVFPNTDLPAGE